MGIRGPISDEIVRERLLERRVVTVDGCWEYTRYRSRDGYGKISWRGRQTTVHRVAFALFVGPIPEGCFVCHRCDNPPCFNPEHLFVGTADDNNADMTAKGRARRLGPPRQPRPEERARGERNGGGGRLTEAQVLAIYRDGRKQREIAVDYEISKGLVSHIKTGRLWSSVTGHSTVAGDSS